MELFVVGLKVTFYKLTWSYLLLILHKVICSKYDMSLLFGVICCKYGVIYWDCIQRPLEEKQVYFKNK